MATPSNQHPALHNPHARAPTVLLMGLRGSGKSTLGPPLAERLRCVFFDLDDLTARRLHSVTAAQAWHRHGEPAFRAAEAAELSTLLKAENNTSGARVIALGGGTPTAPGTADQIRAAVAKGRVHVLYLRATPAQLTERLRTTTLTDRPTLTGRGTLEEITEIFEKRDPLYAQLATHTLDLPSGDTAPASVLNELLRLSSD